MFFAALMPCWCWQWTINSTVEGGQADALITQYEFSNIVGRLRNVEVQLVNELKPYHEIGKRFPTELRPGNLNVTAVPNGRTSMAPCCACCLATALNHRHLMAPSPSRYSILSSI